MEEQPLILLANDDGVHAEGILSLERCLRARADVIVVAPAHEQSGKGHGITLDRPLRHHTLRKDVHAVDGTPADCVYVALYHPDLLPRWPDLVVSGINHGPNLGSDVHYSGTVAAAREGALKGIASVAFSLCEGDDFDQAAKECAALTQRLLDMVASRGQREVEPPLPEGGPPLINVNLPPGKVRGRRATSLGIRAYQDEVQIKHDPRGRPYLWIGGPGAVDHQPVAGSDTEAVDQGYISVTPLGTNPIHAVHLGLSAWLAAG